MKKIGFIGLGLMGKPMARNLMKAGYDVTVYNRSPQAVEEIAEEGAVAAKSSKQVGEQSDVIITIVTDGPDVEEVIVGKTGVLAGVHTGGIIIDMSSISPTVTQKIANICEKQGVQMLDAPVSGGDIGAIKGTLAIMVGGKREVYEECLPILEVLGKTITYVGPSGCGSMAKLANQIVGGIYQLALSEALVFAVKGGLDPHLLLDAIRGGVCGGWMIENKAPQMISGDFTPGFFLEFHKKDIKNALEAAKEMNVPVPLTSLLHEIYKSRLVQGFGRRDHSSVVTYFEEMAGIKVKNFGAEVTEEP